MNVNEPEEKFKLSKEPGFKHRIAEVAATMIVSAISAAITVTWSVSALITRSTIRIDNLEGRISAVESRTNATEGINYAQQNSLAVNEARSQDILRRLDRIETKVDNVREAVRYK